MVQLVRVKSEGGEYGPLHEMALSEVIAWLKANSDAEGNVKTDIVLYGDVSLKTSPEGKCKPKPGESEEQFIGRCIGEMTNQGRNTSQAAAICHSIWEKPKTVDTEEQEEELFEWTMSDYTLDRDLERIDPAGWDLKNYRKNPVVLWGHNPSIPAIGVAQDASVDKETGRLRGKIKFSAKEVDPFAWMIKEKIREGILHTGSVGFRPMKVEIVDHSDDDKNAKGKRDETRLIHRKQELYEFSIVNIPANPSASVRREVELSSAMTTTAPVTATSLFSEIGNYVSGNGNAVDGAWSVRGLGYKQQPGYVDAEHEAIRKELALMTETLAEFKRIMLFPAPTVTVTTTSTEDEPEEDEAEEKAAAGVLADMALRVDDIEEKVNGLIERVGVAEPEPEETASFYDELFKGSRPAPSPLDKLLNPPNPNDKR